MPSYPDIPDIGTTALTAVRFMQERDPGWLDRPDCPYAPGTREVLRAYLGGGSAVSVVDVPNMLAGLDDGEQVDSVLYEIEMAMSQIAAMAEQVHGASVDMGQKIAFAKARVQIIEKWTSIKASLWDAKAVQKFKAVVMDVMANNMDESARKILIEKLKDINA